MLMMYLALLDNDDERSLFTKRYEQYRYDCLRIADSILQDSALSEDAVHEAFLAIAIHRKKYLSIPCRDFRNSIVIIVRNKCIDILRKEKRIVDYPTDDNIFEIENDEPSVEEQIIRCADAQKISYYINKLDEISRQILYMKYIQNLSYKEIGVELKMNVKTVEVRIARAKKKARDMMSKDGEINE